jgi:hypothetical protein
MWGNYMQQIIGQADVPLTYVYRDYVDVTAAEHAAVYVDDHQRYYRTTVLSGEHYSLDNRRVWNELKPLVIDGPGWSFIKSYDATQDGRNAIVALFLQNRSESSDIITRNKAETALANLTYSGPRKQWTFAMFVTAHQEAHNELEACLTPMHEATKVQKFLHGIQDPGLSPGVANVYGDPNRISNFANCQQYMSLLAANLQLHKAGQRARNVGAAATKPSAKSSKADKKRKSTGDYTYPNAEWNALSWEDKQKIFELRKKTKGGRQDRAASRAVAAAAKVAAAAVAQAPAAPAIEAGPVAAPAAQPANNAGNQFGRAPHFAPGTK